MFVPQGSETQPWAPPQVGKGRSAVRPEVATARLLGPCRSRHPEGRGLSRAPGARHTECPARLGMRHGSTQALQRHISDRPQRQPWAVRGPDHSPGSDPWPGCAQVARSLWTQALGTTNGQGARPVRRPSSRPWHRRCSDAQPRGGRPPAAGLPQKPRSASAHRPAEPTESPCRLAS